MTFTLYTTSISAHQLPLAREIVRRIGAENFRYVYTGVTQGGGQDVSSPEPWILRALKDDGSENVQSRDCLENCEVLLSGIRDLDLFERRSRKGLKTFYMSERWFKPMNLGAGHTCKFSFPGWLRLLIPSYRRMVRRLIKLLSSDPNFFYFAIGVWAKRDMLRMGCPLQKIVDWGYFVEPSTHSSPSTLNLQPSTLLRVLWVGRMLDWKRVDTIIRAVALANKTLVKSAVQPTTSNLKPVFTLTLVGDGPEKERLRKLAKHLSTTTTFNYNFLPSVPICEVRTLMRQHDIYVLASNAQEGWGAALNEAMEEGMNCFGTYEAGASLTLLPERHLFHAGDWKTLSEILLSCAFDSTALPYVYAPNAAADKLMEGI